MRQEEVEKIREGLACCRQDPPACDVCPYVDDGWPCSSKLMDEAMEHIMELQKGEEAA